MVLDYCALLISEKVLAGSIIIRASHHQFPFPRLHIEFYFYSAIPKLLFLATQGEPMDLTLMTPENKVLRICN